MVKRGDHAAQVCCRFPWLHSSSFRRCKSIKCTLLHIPKCDDSSTILILFLFFGSLHRSPLVTHRVQGLTSLQAEWAKAHSVHALLTCLRLPSIVLHKHTVLRSLVLDENRFLLEKSKARKTWKVCPWMSIFFPALWIADCAACPRDFRSLLDYRMSSMNQRPVVPGYQILTSSRGRDVRDKANW